MNTFITSRFRRQDTSTTAINNPTPSNCDDLKSTMKDLTNAMDYRAPDYDPARAMDIVAILTSLDSSYLSPGCSSSDLSELNDAKNAAKDNADAVVTTQTTLISAKTDELNALVLLILALNQQISAAGGTIIDPGTSVTPVPVDGEWQEWGQWSDCDPSCSCGKKIRARACTAPLFGGNDCIGDPTETAPCSVSSYQPSCQNTNSSGKF